MVSEAVRDGGDVVGVVHWEASVALGPLAGGPEDRGPCELVRLEASEAAGSGEWDDLRGPFVLWNHLVSASVGGAECAGH